MPTTLDRIGRRKTQYDYFAEMRQTEYAAHQIIQIMQDLTPIQQMTALALVQMSINVQINRVDRAGLL